MEDSTRADSRIIQNVVWNMDHLGGTSIAARFARISWLTEACAVCTGSVEITVVKTGLPTAIEIVESRRARAFLCSRMCVLALSAIFTANIRLFLDFQTVVFRTIRTGPSIFTVANSLEVTDSVQATLVKTVTATTIQKVIPRVTVAMPPFQVADTVSRTVVGAWLVLTTVAFVWSPTLALGSVSANSTAVAVIQFRTIWRDFQPTVLRTPSRITGTLARVSVTNSVNTLDEALAFTWLHGV